MRPRVTIEAVPPDCSADPGSLLVEPCDRIVMERDLSPLDTDLEDLNVDGYMIDDGAENADQRYLTEFTAEQFISLYTPSKLGLLVSGLEYGRATSEAHVDVVRRWSDYDLRDRRDEMEPKAARAAALHDFLDEFNVETVAVPSDFPIGTADHLRDKGVEVTVDTDGIVEDLRATKTDTEIDHIRTAQAANEAAMKRAESLLSEAEVQEGILIHDGDPLTSERVRQEIEITLLRHGCALDETIVACGADGAEPHNRGSGPLAVDEPIVIDIFPRDKTSGYHADMTRTFVVGTASNAVREFHDLTKSAMDAAIDQVEPGVGADTVHGAVCDVYEDAGYQTLRTNSSADTGFIHSTGHGVGLEVHEAPSVSDRGDELEPGHVITIEPGLYDPDIGGMRIEDLLVVTEDGAENLTNYHCDLEL